FARSDSFALFDPADWIQLTVTSSPRVDSIHPNFLMIRLSGLYVAKSMFRVSLLHPLSVTASLPGSATEEPSPAAQPVSRRAVAAAAAVTVRYVRIFIGSPRVLVVQACRCGSDRVVLVDLPAVAVHPE